MYSLRQYLFSLENSFGLTRTLGEVELCRDATGKPLVSSGNSAILFRIRHEGTIKALRCYRYPTTRLRERYGEQLLERELYLYDTPSSGRWVDVVLTDWIEGETLQHHIEQAAQCHDAERFRTLAAAFDRLATRLLADDWAHGDLKPDNLILAADGTLYPIDFDGAFYPAMRGDKAPELGTAAYQHPRRTIDDFDERLDDFSIALHTTALHALALDPTLYDRYGARDGLLFDAQRLPHDPAWQEVVERFAAEGDALHYRTARAMAHPLVQNPDLATLFATEQTACANSENSIPTEVTPELAVEGLYWGYRRDTAWIIPPLYDEGFEFSEGLAAVRLGRHWHFIDTTGHCRLHLPPCEVVKPFRNGIAYCIRGTERLRINVRGEVLDI